MNATISARVLVTVKAYPQLSQRSGEVVCVAGVRLDTPSPQWVRMFPVPFRELPEANRFKKYDIVQVELRRGTDRRPESYRPVLESLTVERSVDPGRDGLWSRRRELLGNLVAEVSACELYRSNHLEIPVHDAPSLGLVKPTEVSDVTVEPNAGFDADRRHLAELAAEASLFGEAREALQASPYVVRYRYRCADLRCPGHHQSLIDWEVGQAGRRWSREYDAEEVPRRIRAKFLDQICGPERDPHFFLGNQHRYRQGFLVLGVFWPRRPSETGLF